MGAVAPVLVEGGSGPRGGRREDTGGEGLGPVPHWTLGRGSASRAGGQPVCRDSPVRTAGHGSPGALVGQAPGQGWPLGLWAPAKVGHVPRYVVVGEAPHERASKAHQFPCLRDAHEAHVQGCAQVCRDLWLWDGAVSAGGRLRPAWVCPCLTFLPAQEFGLDLGRRAGWQVPAQDSSGVGKGHPRAIGPRPLRPSVSEEPAARWVGAVLSLQRKQEPRSARKSEVGSRTGWDLLSARNWPSRRAASEGGPQLALSAVNIGF